MVLIGLEYSQCIDYIAAQFNICFHKIYITYLLYFKVIYVDVVLRSVDKF